MKRSKCKRRSSGKDGMKKGGLDADGEERRWMEKTDKSKR